MIFFLSILVSLNANSMSWCDSLFYSTNDYTYDSESLNTENRRSGYFLERDSTRGYYFDQGGSARDNFNDIQDSRFIEYDNGSNEFNYREDF